MRKFVWAAVASIALIALAATWNVLASHVLHGDVTPRSLYLSIQNESGETGLFGIPRHRVCRRVAEAETGTWSCDVEYMGSVGVATYRVSVHGSCWHATGGNRDLPRSLDGCVHLRED